jgi:hypothetical protein
MKKIYIILLGIILIAIGGYIYIRYSFLKAKDFKPNKVAARSAVDLRPSIIAKLQQLVKDGSGGLYKLNIEKVEPHVLTSTFDVTNATLTPDPEVEKKLDSAHKLPDDIFKISFSSLHINGIVISDFLSKDSFKLNEVTITNPIIEVHHRKRWYNKKKSSRIDATLYQEISKTVKSIAINKIEIQHGKLIIRDKGEKDQVNTINDIFITLRSVLVDSSTQYDRKRFLFAKKALLSTKNFTKRTADSLYVFTCGSIEISTPRNDITATNVEMHPRFNTQQFEKRLSTRKEMFDLVIPKMTLSSIRWWDLANNESIIAKTAVLNNCTFNTFLDRSLPFRKVKPNSFPHQVIMRLPIPIWISKMYLRNSNMSYSEFNPGLDTRGTVYLDNINGEGTNLTNMPEQIRAHQFFTIKANCLLMHKIPMTTSFRFDLSKYKTGDFIVDLEVKEMDTAVLNPITGPLGEFIIKKGSVQKGIAHVTGNNFKTGGTGELLYKDLYLVGLKKDKNSPGTIKHKSVTSFLGNVLLIKNENPSNNKPPRVVTFGLDRDNKSTFISFVWKTILLGILKTIGLPASFANKPY